MAIVDGFCTVAQVKLMLGITALDTSQDALVEMLINQASSALTSRLDRVIKRSVYTSEPYTVNFNQMLYLRSYPIQTITSVTLLGVGLTVNTDSGYYMSSDDAAIGRLYRSIGWNGNTFTRGTVPDTFAGSRDIRVTYTAGYYLPADAGYIEGNPASLPSAISSAAIFAVCERYRRRGAEGLKSLSEGNLSYSWFGDSGSQNGGDSGSQNGGYPTDIETILRVYTRAAIG